MIKFHNVSKSYTKDIFSINSLALRELSFSLAREKTLGLVGVNGAGKSTTIKLLMNFLRPDKGEIQLFNQSPDFSSLRQQVGYLPETASFPASLTILDMLHFTGSVCGIDRSVLKKRSERWLTFLALWEVRHRPLRTYSKGMQQRANFVLALINDPELLIFDEPMSGLDPLGRSKIIALIQQLKKCGKTIIFCSHILEDVDKLVDDILLLHKGQKLFYGTPSELIAQENCSSMTDAFVSVVERVDHHG